MKQGFDTHRFARDYQLSISPSGHKHHRAGWINIPCPYCRGAGYHLGLPIGKPFGTCYKCGPRGMLDIIQHLLRVAPAQAWSILEKYSTGAVYTEDEREDREAPTLLSLPEGAGRLRRPHLKYLVDRGFRDPDALAEDWNLLATGHTGPYKFRIIAPIYYRGKMVSFQGRDITGKSELKYKACPQDKEVIPHKHLLYGYDKIPSHSIIVVEGIVDVWKLGPGAVCTFGVKWTLEQLNKIKEFPRRFIMFDSNEEEAQAQAEKLAASLSAFSGTTEIVELEEGDAGDLSMKEAHTFMKNLGF